MQKDDHDKTVQPAFNEAAQLPEEAQMMRRVAALPANLQAQYHLTVDRQERDLKFLKNELQASREDNIADRAQRLRDRWEKERRLNLRPKYLPSVSDKELERQARTQAVTEVEMEEQQRLQQMDQMYFQERVELIINLEFRFEKMSHFNAASSPPEIEIDLEEDRGR